MRILYGVVGEGLGHAVRSRVVIQHLIARGHEVQVMTSRRAHVYLARHFRNVNQIHGLHLVARGNRICKHRTLLSNAAQIVRRLPANVAAYFRLISNFRPELVVSDFESWSHLYGKIHRIPVISIDNMSAIDRCAYPGSIIEGRRLDHALARAFIAAKMSSSSHYLVTSMFDMPATRPRTSVMRPILRPELLAARPERGEHLLVYQTFDGHSELESALRATGMECRIYGMRRDLKRDEVDGRLRHRPISEQGFIDDLASARAVVGPGGFSLMSEAIHLGKPMLSIPIAGQFEQEFNARMLAHAGWGARADAIDGDGLPVFIDELPRFESALARRRSGSNAALLGRLDDLIEDHERHSSPQLQAVGQSRTEPRAADSRREGRGRFAAVAGLLQESAPAFSPRRPSEATGGIVQQPARPACGSSRCISAPPGFEQVTPSQRPFQGLSTTGKTT